MQLLCLKGKQSKVKYQKGEGETRGLKVWRSHQEGGSQAWAGGFHQSDRGARSEDHQSREQICRELKEEGNNNSVDLEYTSSTFYCQEGMQIKANIEQYNTFTSVRRSWRGWEQTEEDTSIQRKEERCEETQSGTVATLRGNDWLRIFDLEEHL